MKVILTTNIKKLGKIGDLVDVKNGYARNFLFPNKMALRENKKNLEYYEKIKEEVQEKEAKKLEEAKNTIEKIKSLKIEFSKEADEKDQLYGSITKKEIVSFLKQNKVIIHSGFGYNLWQGNNPNSTVEGSEIINQDFQNLIAEIPKDKFYRIKEDKVFINEALKNIKNEPVRYLILYFKFFEAN